MDPTGRGCDGNRDVGAVGRCREQRVHPGQGQLHVPAGLVRVDVPQLQQEPLVVGGDVPALPDQGPALPRFELVAPDPSGHVALQGALRSRLPGDAPVIVELHHRADRGVADTELHRHAEGHPEGQPRCDPGRGPLEHGRAVDEGVLRRIGQDIEDDLGAGPDVPFDGQYPAIHRLLPTPRRSTVLSDPRPPSRLDRPRHARRLAGRTTGQGNAPGERLELST